MKYLKASIVLFAAFLVFACSSAPSPQASATGAQPSAGAQTTAAPPAKSDIWPKIYGDETYLTDFASTWSEDEAIGAIKNLQNSFVEYKAGIPLASIDVDRFGLRAKWQWIENNSFVKSASFIIAFDQVTSILLEHYPTLDKDYKWGIIVYLSDNTNVSIRTPTRDAAERLGKATIVLSKARGAKLGLPYLRFGTALASLSDDQAQAAGIQKTAGIIVQWVFEESPAKQAGFSAQDIITMADGKPVHRSDDLFSAIDAAAAAGASQIKIDGLRRSYRIENNKYVEVFVPLTYILAIAPAGSAQ